ncbi:Crp/Fnr family transcriptional regulator [Flavobacteriaceae bacterium]|nr:Crp/Fnr family transcriptional regulator [Flavobacteriaceae bacterium]
MDNFKNYLNSIYPISDKSYEDLLTTIEVKSYKENEIIDDVGDIPTHYYFIKFGIVRSYVLKGEEEINLLLSSSDEFIGSYRSLVLNTSSRIGFQCLTDCSIIRINYQDYINISFGHKDLTAFNLKALHNLYIKKERRLFSLLSYTPKELYIRLRRDHDRIDYMISTNQIASYIGTSPSELVKYREELLEKNEL